MADLQCPKCGKPSTGVCGECYINDHPFSIKVESYKDCTNCGTTIYKGTNYVDRHEMFKVLAAKSIKPPAGVKFRVFDISAEEVAGKAKIKADILATFEGEQLTKTLRWDVRPQKITCDVCKKLSAGYYEAIIQVREPGLALDYDEKKVSDIEPVRGGVDYYITSNDYARELVGKLINKGYLVQDSSKLFGRKGDTDLYRHYFSIKHAHFREGDFIEYEDKIFRVEKISRMVKLHDVKTHKDSSATINKLSEVKIIAKAKDAKNAYVTEIRPDGMQIMDCQDCQTYELPLKPGYALGQEVGYLKVVGKVYVL